MPRVSPLSSRWIAPPAWRAAPVAVLLATCLLMAGCSGTSAPAAGRELQRSLGGEPGSLDPQLAADTYAYEVLRDFREGLVTEGPQGQLLPGQAQDWTVSDDGRVYRFRLRPGLMWSDGTPVVAHDFVAALRRAVDPATASPNGALLRPIAGAAEILSGHWPASRLGAEASTPGELTIRLIAPAEYLPALLAHPVAFPRGPATGGEAYNGAYLPASNSGKSMPASAALASGDLHAVANPRFRAAASVGIRRIHYLMLADEQAELLRYQAGELDITAGLPADQLAWARRERPTELQLAPQGSTFFLGLNLRGGVLGGDVRLREALSLAVDREWITQRLLAGGQRPAYRLVPPALLPAPTALLPWDGWSTARRLTRARALYAAAGFSAGRPLKLRLLYNRNTTVRRVVLAIAAAWRERLGVEVELLDEEFATYLEARRRPSGWEVVRLGWNADYPDGASFLEVFRREGEDNDVGYADAAYDRWLDLAARTSGSARQQALQSAESKLLGDHAIVPVYFLVTRRLVRPELDAGVPNPLNHNYTRWWRWSDGRP